MLLFAVFTLGYFFGVFITLKVFGQKDKVEGYQPVNTALNSGKKEALSSWDIFTQLTKINYPKDTNKLSPDVTLQRGFVNSTKSESKQEQAYATS